MKTSMDRILITHVGVCRPDDLVDLLRLQDRGKDVDGAVLDTRISEVIDDLVALQVENGVDVVTMVKPARCLITYMPSTD